MHMFKKGLISVLALGVAACGESGNSGTVNQQQATTATTQSISALEQAISTNNGEASAQSLLGASLSNSTLVQPAAAALQNGTGVISSAQTTGTCDCNETSCTFTNCSYGYSGSSWTMNGTMSWTATTILCDMTYAGDFQGQSYTMDLDCNITMTDTSIDGTLNSTGSYDNTQFGISGSWSTDSTYNNVTFNNSSCPTSGSIDIDASQTAAGQSYSYSGTVTFDGTTCTQ